MGGVGRGLYDEMDEQPAQTNWVGLPHKICDNWWSCVDTKTILE